MFKRVVATAYGTVNLSYYLEEPRDGELRLGALVEFGEGPGITVNGITYFGYVRLEWAAMPSRTGFWVTPHGFHVNRGQSFGGPPVTDNASRKIREMATQTAERIYQGNKEEIEYETKHDRLEYQLTRAEKDADEAMAKFSEAQSRVDEIKSELAQLRKA